MTGDKKPSGSASPSTRASLVPSKANGVLHLDLEMMRTNKQLEKLFNAGVEQGSGAQSFDEALAESGLEGVDAKKIYDMVIFGEIPEDFSMMGSTGSSYGGGIVFTGIDSSTLISALKNQQSTDYTEQTYNGHKLLQDNSTENSFLGVVSNGVYAGGTEQAVKDVIDIAEGSGSTLSGDVKTAITSARKGAARFAFEVPKSSGDSSTGGSMGGQMSQKIEIVSGTMLYQTGGNVGLELTLTMTDNQAASQFKQQMDFFLKSYKSRYEQQSGGEQVVRILENVSISQSGKAVTINYEDTVENLIALSKGEGLPVGGT